MERVRKALKRSPSYEPLEGGSVDADGETTATPIQEPFSWTDYSIFLLLGVAMLWAWNMFLAANPYFQKRFRSNERIAANFQSTELTVFTVANLGFMLVLTKLQATASYPRRIIAALLINVVTFTLLALSTRIFVGVSPAAYLAFLIAMVLVTSLATGACQNGVFAYVSTFGREEYTQAIMAGQGVAGVLPCVAQIVSVLSVPDGGHRAAADVADESSRSAFAYFLTATAISAVTLAAFLLLLHRHGHRHQHKVPVVDAGEANSLQDIGHHHVPLMLLLRKLRWLAAAIFLTFTVTMIYPVFTGRIDSVRTGDDVPRLFQPGAFIPLAFLFWNVGDLLGRLLPAVPALSLTGRPRVLFALSACRLVFIPLYLLCNLRGRSGPPPVRSDFFYLVVVQLLFGVSNGYVGSGCMMAFAEWVEVHEREAAGGFMSLCLVAGLTAGSMLSFWVATLGT